MAVELYVGGQRVSAAADQRSLPQDGLPPLDHRVPHDRRAIDLVQEPEAAIASPILGIRRVGRAVRRGRGGTTNCLRSWHAARPVALIQSSSSGATALFYEEDSSSARRQSSMKSMTCSV